MTSNIVNFALTARHIKPLAWEVRRDGSLEAAAFGLALAYRISGKQGDWNLLRTGATSYITDEGFETQAQAKAAAQADYAARIIDAILPEFCEVTA